MGKKKGKKSGGKKKGGKKKNAEPEMTFKEAILAYQIGIKEKQIEDAKYELRGQEEKNKRHRERNDRLVSEQQYYIQHLMQQAKDYEKQLESASEVTKEEVIEVMKESWEAEKKEKRDIIEMQTKLKDLDIEMAKQQQQRAYWNDYKDKGQHTHNTQIKLLKSELEDMERSFNEMKTHLERTLMKAKSEIEEKMSHEIEHQKHTASEKAMAKLDKGSKQEVLDNDWLKREAEIHRRDHAELLSIVEDLEKRNLEIMSDLFECKVEDLKISRNFYLTQFEDEDDLDQSGILEIDLQKMTIDSRSTSVQREQEMAQSSSRAARPKSATQKAVEDKVFTLVPVNNTKEDEDSEEEDEEDHTGSGEDLLDNYFNFEDEDFNDYLQLGPLELKLLNVRGTTVNIHNQMQPTEEELKMKDCSPDDWPVTQPMLQSVTHS